MIHHELASIPYYHPIWAVIGLAWSSTLSCDQSCVIIHYDLTCIVLYHRSWVFILHALSSIMSWHLSYITICYDIPATVHSHWLWAVMRYCTINYDMSSSVRLTRLWAERVMGCHLSCVIIHWELTYILCGHRWWAVIYHAFSKIMSWILSCVIDYELLSVMRYRRLWAVFSTSSSFTDIYSSLSSIMDCNLWRYIIDYELSYFAW